MADSQSAERVAVVECAEAKETRMSSSFRWASHGASGVVSDDRSQPIGVVCKSLEAALKTNQPTNRRFSMSGDDLLQRRIDEKCIRCGTRVYAATSDGRQVIDLPPLYCTDCEAAMDAERLRQNRLRPSAKKIRDEGVA